MIFEVTTYFLFGPWMAVLHSLLQALQRYKKNTVTLWTTSLISVWKLFRISQASACQNGYCSMVQHLYIIIITIIAGLWKSIRAMCTCKLSKHFGIMPWVVTTDPAIIQSVMVSFTNRVPVPLLLKEKKNWVYCEMVGGEGATCVGTSAY